MYKVDFFYSDHQMMNLKCQNFIKVVGLKKDRKVNAA
jgi:hypothetical protein